MPQSNAAATSNVTTLIQPKDNLHEAIDALHSAQITGEYRYTALAMAGPLISEVGKIFPRHMILIYMATSAKRRQVWHAYIAAMYANPANPQPITNPDAVRAKLMNTSSKALLLKAYGSIPEGYATATHRLGLNGHEPRIYLMLHEFMTASSEHRKSFSHASKIEASTVETMAALPETLQSYDLAKQIKKPEDIKKLTFIIDTLAQGDEVKYADICAKVVDAAKRGHSVSKVLERVYHQTRFPDPLIQDTVFCKHIKTCADLHKASLQFQNCLKQYFEEGIRGEHQYYRWFENNRPVAVISIREDAPYGWRIFEMKGKKNEYIDDELELKIIKHFEEQGIYSSVSMDALLRELGGVLGRGGRRDPVDQINDVIDELLDEDPI